MGYNFKKIQGIDFYSYTGSMDLYAVRRQLAKATNERIRQLEKTVSPVTGESYAYGKGYDIVKEYLDEEGRSWFSEGYNRKLDADTIIEEINVLQQFLSYKTSKVSIQKKVEQKRLKTFTEFDYMNPETLKSKEFWEFLNSETYETLTRFLTSEDIQEYFARAVDDGVKPDDIVKEYDKYVQKIIREETKFTVKDIENLFNVNEVK